MSASRPSWCSQIEPGSAAKDILSADCAGTHRRGFPEWKPKTSVTLAPAWSPDGREVIFTATTERWNAAFAHVGYHLYRMAAAGSEPATTTPASGIYEEAMFSADGKALYFKYAPQDAEVYHLAQLYKVAWPAGGPPTLVTRDFDRESARYALTPDGKSVYLLVPDAGKQSLYRVAAAGGKPALLIEPATGGYTALQIPAKAPKPALIASFGSSVSPAEIVRIDPAAAAARQPHSRRYRGSCGDRLAAAAAFLFHQRQGPQHSQHDRAAAGIRPGAEISAVGT